MTLCNVREDFLLLLSQPQESGALLLGVMHGGWAYEQISQGGREHQGTTRNCSLIINCADIEKASFLVIGCFEIPTSRVHIA